MALSFSNLIKFFFFNFKTAHMGQESFSLRVLYPIVNGVGLLPENTMLQA